MKYKALLCWSSTHEVLTATDTSIQDVKGLSAANKQLLKQCGAVGEASKTLISMASVASKLKLPSNRDINPRLAA
ncbi:hypothetical protein [Mycoavidus sp. SF9855]|uniref:hypothetical protein n=1 Tax=Mycoavidus sp. SF9855 TaxID=2968475 RepID=UPI00211C27E1|nr:hypothetical protein [Mycoavidus sp. SF9855]UUM21443.1 hypothetical protein NQD60_08465 [Mycoavidus sp. SF9855]